MDLANKELAHDDQYVEDAHDGQNIEHEHDAQEWTQQNPTGFFVFADRNEVPALRNDVITALITEIEKGDHDNDRDDGNSYTWLLAPSYFHLIRLAFDNLPKNSTLIRYIIAEAAWSWRDVHFADKNLGSLPADFLAGVANAGPVVKKKRKDGCEDMPSWREALCVYHEHDGDDEAIARCVEVNQKLQSSLKSKIKQQTRKQNGPWR